VRILILEVSQKHLPSLFRRLSYSRGTDTSPPCYLQDTEEMVECQLIWCAIILK
jgi:hypothetical protein